MIRRVRVSQVSLATLIVLAPALWFGCAGPGPHGQDRHGHEQGGQQHQAHHRRPADVQEYLAHLDRPERDEYQKPSQVIDALTLPPGLAIADLGAGSGYFTRRFVEALHNTGTVYAVDVEQEMLDYVKRSLEGMDGASTVRYILAERDSPGMPPNSVDLVFVCNVYHHLDDRPAYFQRVKPMLKPGGRIAIVDFYHDHRSGDVGFPRRHLVARDTVLQEMSAAGYTVLKEHTFLERQYFLEFSPARS